MDLTSSVVVIMLFIYWIATFIIHWQGLKLVPKLPSAKIKQSNQQLISIIIAARNEEKSIIDTIESLKNQVYQNVEVIVVNDRSTDQTGIIVERFINEQTNQSAQSSLKLIHIYELPKGWLGKNYALLQGYLNAVLVQFVEELSLLKFAQQSLILYSNLSVLELIIFKRTN